MGVGEKQFAGFVHRLQTFPRAKLWFQEWGRGTWVASSPLQEREMLKTILTETVEVLLRRHEIVHKEASVYAFLTKPVWGCGPSPALAS